MSERVNPFGNLNGFSPAVKEKKPVEQAVIDQVAVENHFPSRQLKKVYSAATVHIKATHSTIARF